MELADEFRRHASNCFRWAKEARSIADEVRWLEMAQFWLKLAQHAEEQEAMRPIGSSPKSEQNGSETSDPSGSEK